MGVFAEPILMWEKYYLGGPISLDDFSARSIMLSNWTKLNFFFSEATFGIE
jgi:hypothetical protein